MHHFVTVEDDVHTHTEINGSQQCCASALCAIKRVVVHGAVFRNAKMAKLHYIKINIKH